MPTMYSMTREHRRSSLSLRRTATGRRWPVLLCLLLSLLPGLACGNLLPGPEPTVPLPSSGTEVLAAAATATATPTPEPTATSYPTRTPTPAPTVPTATPTPLPPDVLRPDAPARVVAPQGLNIREAATTESKQVGRFPPGSLVTVREGPVEAGGYTWWRVESGQALSGWVADSDADTTWLTGDIGEPRPVNRPVRLGDRVTVSTAGGKWLALRYQPAGTLIRRVPGGTQFTVKDGPTDAEAFRWWLLLDDDGMEGWGAESDKETRWLTPME
jgi:hypothetical protein